MDDATLIVRLCEILGRIPTFAWYPEPGTRYAPHRVGVFAGAIDATPDRAVGVQLYGVDDGRDVRGRMIQLHHRGARGDVLGAIKLAQVTNAALSGLSRERGISGTVRVSIGSLGPDKSGREERTDNYLIILDNMEASS